jgi:hypothetical protein
MELPASLPSPSRRAAASQVGVIMGVASEAADVVLVLNEATTNAILYGSRRGSRSG